MNWVLTAVLTESTLSPTWSLPSRSAVPPSAILEMKTPYKAINKWLTRQAPLKPDTNIDNLKLPNFIRFTETSLFKRIAKFELILGNLSKILITARDSALIAKETMSLESLYIRHVIFPMAYFKAEVQLKIIYTESPSLYGVDPRPPAMLNPRPFSPPRFNVIVSFCKTKIWKDIQDGGQ